MANTGFNRIQVHLKEFGSLLEKLKQKISTSSSTAPAPPDGLQRCGGGANGGAGAVKGADGEKVNWGGNKCIWFGKNKYVLPNDGAEHPTNTQYKWLNNKWVLKGVTSNNLLRTAEKGRSNAERLAFLAGPPGLGPPAANPGAPRANVPIRPRPTLTIHIPNNSPAPPPGPASRPNFKIGDTVICKKYQNTKEFKINLIESMMDSDKTYKWRVYENKKKVGGQNFFEDACELVAAQAAAPPAPVNPPRSAQTTNNRAENIRKGPMGVNARFTRKSNLPIPNPSNGVNRSGSAMNANEGANFIGRGKATFANRKAQNNESRERLKPKNGGITRRKGRRTHRR